MHRPSPTITRRTIALLLAAAATAAIAGCRGPDPSPITVEQPHGPAVVVPPPGTWPTDAVGNPVGWTDCENVPRHYKIAYPGGWSTASLGDEDRCTLFDPVAFTVDGLPSLVTQQIAVYSIEMTGAALTDVFTPDFYTVTAQANVTINSHPGIRFTISTLPPTGPSGPAYPRGTELYGYLFPDGSRTLEVVTFVLPTASATRTDREHIIDQAATTIRFTA